MTLRNFIWPFFHFQTNHSSFEEVPQIILSESGVEVSDDYTKRKHVFRVRTEAGSEVLYQAESEASLQHWLTSLEGVVGPQHLNLRVRKLTSAVASTGRNRSPTGHSPATKTRKPSAGKFYIFEIILYFSKKTDS